MSDVWRLLTSERHMQDVPEKYLLYVDNRLTEQSACQK